MRTLAPLTHLALAMALPALAAPSQGPAAPWRTVATRHYLIHYPVCLTAWAQDVAGRIEGIHQAVVDQVGYACPERIQVVLMDPEAEPNGMALPLLPHPYVVLWRTEPSSDDSHGNALASWTGELVSHELTHIHHLTRTARPRSVLDSLVGLPVGPLVLKCPRWVMEGYATLCEGRITGSGRPHSAYRAAVIRQWALAGKLPPYETLATGEGFLGGNMAYLVGSAYLEWLARTRPADPDALRRFWRQLASRRNRSFEDAFKATFGFTVRDGYQRFQAEAAHDALEWEATLKTRGLREGDRVLRTDGMVRSLGVSPDGKRLLVSMDNGRRPGLRVYDLAKPAPAPPTPKPDAYNPTEDVPYEWPEVPLATSLPALNHRLPRLGEWVDDHTIRFQMKRADAEGVLHPEPALWHLEAGVDRSPRPVPEPAFRTLTPVLREGAWVLELDGTRLPLPGQAMGRAVLDAARNTVYAACEVEGFWNLVALPVTRREGVLTVGAPRVLTRTCAGAWNPAPTPDGKALYYTSLDPQGLAIRRLDLTLPPLPAIEAQAPRILSPRTVTAPAPEPVKLPLEAGPLPSHPYRATEDPWIQVSGGLSLTPSGTSYETGLSGSDLLGHLSWQALAALGDAAGPRGATAGLSSSAWRWSPSFQVFSALERPSRQRDLPVARDRERRGAEVALTYEDRGEHPFWFSPVAGFERVEALDAPGVDPARKTVVGVRGGWSALWARGSWGLEALPVIQAFRGRTTGGGTQDWTLLKGGLTVRMETPFQPFSFSASGGRLSTSGHTDQGEAFHLGGVTTSLVPESLDADRIAQPAFPAYLAVGDRFVRWRGQVGGAFHAYLEGTTVWESGGDRGPAQRVAGLELQFTGSASTLSLATNGRTELRMGIHRCLDGIMKGRTVGTLTLVARP